MQDVPTTNLWGCLFSAILNINIIIMIIITVIIIIILIFIVMGYNQANYYADFCQVATARILCGQAFTLRYALWTFDVSEFYIFSTCSEPLHYII